MVPAKQIHRFAFYGNGAGALNTASFTVDIFTVDGNSVSSAVSDSLVISEVSDSYYETTYIPDSPGKYILAVSNVAHNIHVVDDIDVGLALDSFNLSQDYPTTGALKPTGTNLSSYVLLVFNSKDWDVGRTQSRQAIAQTGLDNNGNWLVTPLVLLHGLYHIVIRNSDNKTIVIAPYLTI